MGSKDLLVATIWALDEARVMIEMARASGTAPDAAQAKTRMSALLQQCSPEQRHAVEHVLGAVEAASQGNGYGWT